MRRLTPRQQQIAELASQGMSNRRIARAMRTTEGAIKTCLSRIYDKQEISTRYELIAKKNVTKVTV